MLKKIVTICTVVLFCAGCSWFGKGDETASATAVTEPVEQAAVQEEKAQTPDPNAKNASAKSSKSAKKDTVKSSGKAVKKTEAQIKAELDQMGKKLAAQSARTLVPNKAKMDVKKVGSQWVASYIDVNTDKVTTEMRPGTNGQYVGFIRYQENFMESHGATKEAAMKGPFNTVRTRNLNELIHYDGKAWQE